jgi:ABC-type sugar transport system permease subunit
LRLVWDNLVAGSQSDIWANIKNTLLYYVVGLVSQFVISFFFAYCLCRKILLHNFFNIVFLVPMVVSAVVLVAVYKNLLGSDGPVQALWKTLSGQDSPHLLYDPRYATPSILIYVLLTSIGLNMIIYSGAMSRIPPELWEQSKLDGVGFMRGMFSLAFPLIWPTYSIMLLLGTIGILGADGPILLFTDGMYGTSTLGFWMFDNVVRRRLYNYASALGLFMTIVTLPVFFIVMYVRKKVPEDIQY